MLLPRYNKVLSLFFIAAIFSTCVIPCNIRANDFRNNPSFVIDAKYYPQFSFVGRLEREESFSDTLIRRESGSAIIVSPCHILTNYHVAFDDNLILTLGRDYSMVFRAGIGQDDGAFAGHTIATPVLWGDYDLSGRNDWAILRLKNCVGVMGKFGWAEASDMAQNELVDHQIDVLAVGYSYKMGRNELSAGPGKIIGVRPDINMMAYTASISKGESGGAIFAIENGIMKLVGINTREENGKKGKNKVGALNDTFDSWDKDHSNLAQSAFEILNRANVKAILDEDKRRFSVSNPALERLTLPLPMRP